MNFCWDTDGPEIIICPRPIWTDGIVVDDAARWIDGGVTASGWHELAADFLERFSR